MNGLTGLCPAMIRSNHTYTLLSTLGRPSFLPNLPLTPPRCEAGLALSLLLHAPPLHPLISCTFQLEKWASETSLCWLLKHRSVAFSTPCLSLLLEPPRLGLSKASRALMSKASRTLSCVCASRTRSRWAGVRPPRPVAWRSPPPWSAHSAPRSETRCAPFITKSSLQRER